MSAKKTKEEMVLQAKTKHGENAFDYSEYEYVDSKTASTIICNTCGHHFRMTMNAHTRGSGCPDCAQRIIAEKNNVQELFFSYFY